MKNCRNCIWLDKCVPQEGGCVHYYSVIEEEREAEVRREYREVLEENREEYQDYIDEMKN